MIMYKVWVWGCGGVGVGVGVWGGGGGGGCMHYMLVALNVMHWQS